MSQTLLSTLLNRMDRLQSVQTVEQQYKVRDLDDAIRTYKRSYNLPWLQKQSSLKVFQGVYEYPPASDHDYLIYLDYNKKALPFGSHLLAKYTNLRDFNEDPTNQSMMAEIWSNNNLVIGVKDKNQLFGAGSQMLDEASSITNHTASADASGLAVSYVNFITGNSSIQFTNTNTTNAATVSDTFTSFTDADYARKWYFRWVYLSAVPTSVTLKYGADSSNYLYGTVTAQFSGQAFTANQWNFLAFDLNAPTGTTGTISTSTSWAYESTTLNSAATGTYYLDASYIKTWTLLDYWYYSTYSVALTGSTTANQEYFFNSSEAYATDSSLVGPTEWSDLILYEALSNCLSDKENEKVWEQITLKKKEAIEALEFQHPSIRPPSTSNRYRFGDGVYGGDDTYNGYTL